MTKIVQKQNKTQSVDQRMIVLEMLLTENVFSHIVVREVLNKYNYLPQQEKAFMKRLYEGTLERQIELDYVINQYSKIKTEKMKKVICAIMRMSVYQILYMDAVPNAAACNEAVKLAQKKGFASLKGFVNGVLRNIARNKDNITYTSLSVKYSMPEWIINLWIEQFGVKTTETMLAGLLKEHLVTIRFRKMLDSVDVSIEDTVSAVRNALAEQGGTIKQHPYLPCAYCLSGTDDLTKLPYYKNGAFVVQDISSMLAIKAIGIEKYVSNLKIQDTKKIITVVDLCAAPGGKSMFAADILEQSGVNYTIYSRDISIDKVDTMLENFYRCQLKNIIAEIVDATVEEERLVESADIVIADVPCSGFGVIGKKRDIKYRTTPESIAEVIALQKQILAVAARYLKPGGRLLFSTCTINQNENERHFAWLRDALKLVPLSLNDTLPVCLHTETTQEGYLQLLPGVHNADGFFISVFYKPDREGKYQYDGERII